MSEKLYKSHCNVPGHGMSCSMADDIYLDKRGLSKLRRKRSEKIIKEELADIFVSREYEPDQTDRMFRFGNAIPACDCDFCAEEYWKNRDRRQRQVYPRKRWRCPGMNGRTRKARRCCRRINCGSVKGVTTLTIVGR